MRTVPGVTGPVGCAARTGNPPRNRHRMAGLTYVEVLIATALIAITLIPAIEALKPAVQGMSIHEAQIVRHYELAAMLEDVLATPFAELDAEAVIINDPAVASTTYSDLPAANNRRLVYLSRYDADNADGNGDFFDAGMDAGLLWVRIEIEGTDQAIESLTSVYD
jgi:type II secretory pathway pseudopilin PulG